jgi:hypothetical protein
MTAEGRDGPRIWVVGISGSGKTTVAAQAAARLRIPHVQLDAIRQGIAPTETLRQEFREVVSELLAQDAWVVDGNYPVVRDILTARATAIVWLDPPRHQIVAQVFWRSLVRALTRLRQLEFRRLRAKLGRQHDVPWVGSTYARRRAEFPEFLDERCVRLRSRRAMRAWIESLIGAPTAATNPVS